MYDIVRNVLKFHGAADEAAMLDDGSLEFQLQLAYLLHNRRVAPAHVVIARLGDCFVHQRLVLCKQLLFIGKPLSDGLHVPFVLLRPLEHIYGQKIYYVVLLTDETVHLTVYTAHHFDTTAEILPDYHLLQKKLLDIYLALILDLLRVEIEFDTVSRDKVQNLSACYMAVDQLHSTRLSLLFPRIVKCKLERPAIILYLVKYIHYQVSPVGFIDLHVKIPVKKLTHEFFVFVI